MMMMMMMKTLINTVRYDIYDIFPVGRIYQEYPLGPIRTRLKYQIIISNTYDSEEKKNRFIHIS